jgi:hypothetical protein
MPERLVDVEKQGSKVLHTFPVTISAPAVEEEAFKEKALEAGGQREISPERGTRDFWHQAQHQRFCERAYALWSGKAVRKARRTSTGFGRAPLKRADPSSVTKKGKSLRRGTNSPSCNSRP